MTVALTENRPEDLLTHLILADISPAKGALTSEFKGYTEAMQKIEQRKVTTRKEAQEILIPYEPVCHPNFVRYTTNDI